MAGEGEPGVGPALGEARLAVLAREVAGAGDLAREVRTRLGALDGLDWDGAGAAAFRARLAELRRGAEVVAAGCEEAAGRLGAHRAAVAALGAATAAAGPVGSVGHAAAGGPA